MAGIQKPTLQKPALDLAAEAIRFASENSPRTSPEAAGTIKTVGEGASIGEAKKTAHTAPNDDGNSGDLAKPERNKGGRPKKAVQRALEASGAKRSVYSPDGDVRLTINIREDLRIRLGMAAALRRSTSGKVIEDLIEKYLPELPKG